MKQKKYAKLLGYNYQSSEWYKNSYSLFNAKYKMTKKKKITKRKTLKKIKSLFDWNE
jgi:outer membrane protein assembly factor BamD